MTGPDRDRFPRGEARYLADLVDATTLHAGFVRSPAARGRIRGVDHAAALLSPGVLMTVGPQEAARELQALQLRYGPGRSYPWGILPAEQASYPGEPIAAVVATSRTAAEDAIELVSADIEWEEPVVEAVRALEEGSPLARPEVGTNLAFTLTRGMDDVRAEMAASAVIVSERFHTARKSASPLETRGVLAWVEELTGQVVVVTSTQAPHIARRAIAQALGRPQGSVRVVVPDVGGAFGVKAQVYAEEIVVAWLAVRLGRRVCWIEDRWENLVAACHGHDELIELTGGFDADGRIRAVEARTTVDVGAHSCWPFSAALVPSSVTGHLFGCYKVPAMRAVATGVFTNKAPLGAYRGVGAPGATFATERLLDEAAARLGIDRIAIRERNLVSAADMPYEHPAGSVYEGGDPRALFRRAVELASEAGVLPPDGTVPSAARGGGRATPLSGRPAAPVSGVGMAVFGEHSGPGSSVYRGRGVDEVPGYDATRIRLTPEGDLQVFLSSADAGQDHAATCRTEVARILGVVPERVQVVEGDTHVCPPGTGTFASRFAAAHLASAYTAAVSVRQRIRDLAAGYLSCPAGDLIPTEGGGYTTPGGTGQITLSEIARRADLGEGADKSHGLPVEETGLWDGKTCHPWGAMVALVEVDPALFLVTVKHIIAVEDCGRILNRPAVMEQLRGGIVMGIGDALYEEHFFSETGELLTASLLDYLLPVAEVTPVMDITLAENADPNDTATPGKGVGEAGTIGAFAAVGAAVASAVAALGGRINELPGSPARIFESIR